MTNCWLHRQKVFVRFDLKTVCQRYVPTSSRLASWAGVQWDKEVITHAEIDITHMLDQLRKFTVTQDELSHPQKREKWFIGGLPAAASVVSSLLSLGVSAGNAVQMSAIKRNVGELQAKMPIIQEQQQPSNKLN